MASYWTKRVSCLIIIIKIDEIFAAKVKIKFVSKNCTRYCWTLNMLTWFTGNNSVLFALCMSLDIGNFPDPRVGIQHATFRSFLAPHWVFHHPLPTRLTCVSTDVHHHTMVTALLDVIFAKIKSYHNVLFTRLLFASHQNSVLKSISVSDGFRISTRIATSYDQY